MQEKLRKEKAGGRKEDKEVKLSWELVIITGLLSLLGVLLILVVVLTIRLRHARKEERNAGRVLLVPSTLSSGHYVPGADDPCSDLKKKGKLRSKQRSAPSESGSDKQCEHRQTNDGNEQMTDSSLCSSEQEKELSGGSCESLPPPHNLRQHHGSQPCLQSVGLSRHLAIRPGPEGGSLRLQRPPRHLQPYPGPGDLPPKPYPGHPGDRRPSQSYLSGGSQKTFSVESPLLPGHSYRSESPLQPLPCPNTYYNSASTGGSESPYNTVKIVYKKGQRRMELSCQVEVVILFLIFL